VPSALEEVQWLELNNLGLLPSAEGATRVKADRDVDDAGQAKQVTTQRVGAKKLLHLTRPHREERRT
jgi:hypothetical protein